MVVKAKTSFAGIVTMFGGEERDITDEQVVKDLLACGYVISLEDDKSNADNSTTPDNLEHTDDKSNDDVSDFENGVAEAPEQKETKDENKRTAK